MKHMNEQGNTLRGTDLATCLVVGRVSRVTLGLLLSTHLADSRQAGHSSALARLMRARDGLISSAEDYGRAELTFVALSQPAATFQMWLTQYATTLGYLIGSGGDPLSWRSIRLTSPAILSTLAARDLMDAAEYTTKRERARALTRWALGVGRFSRDTPLETIWRLLWRQENLLRNGFQLSSEVGFSIGESTPLGKRK
jgi:hypothetical protein